MVGGQSGGRSTGSEEERNTVMLGREPLKVIEEIKYEQIQRKRVKYIQLFGSDCAVTSGV
jgi:hypothetical protein